MEKMDNEKFFYAENISGGYGKNKVIDDISFSLNKNSLTAVIGANGCGKTTLLKFIANLLKHEGSCYLKGERLEGLSGRRISQMISYIPQKSGISISLPVREIVLMGFNPVLKMLERPNKKHFAAAQNALETVGIGELYDRDFLTLSEGQKQLVFLARTLVEDSSLLLLDEPDSALDFKNRYHILSILKDMVEKGDRAGLLCLHDPALALEFCTQLILIKGGKCIDVIDKNKDSLEKMNEAFKNIYDRISLSKCTDSKGKEHIAVLWEGKA